MAGFITIERDIWDHPIFKDGAFSEREAMIWMMAHGRIIRATIKDLSRAWSSSARRVAYVLRRLEKRELISIHGSGPSRTIFVSTEFGHPCGFFCTTNGWQKFGPGAGLWRGSPLSEATRKAVLMRDGYACRYCGSMGGPFDIDHVHPVSLGGSDDMTNLAASCASCNRSKGAKPLSEWSGCNE